MRFGSLVESLRDVSFTMTEQLKRVITWLFLNGAFGLREIINLCCASLKSLRQSQPVAALNCVITLVQITLMYLFLKSRSIIVALE
jgi:hypothetical protein